MASSEYFTEIEKRNYSVKILKFECLISKLEMHIKRLESHSEIIRKQIELLKNESSYLQKASNILAQEKVGDLNEAQWRTSCLRSELLEIRNHITDSADECTFLLMEMKSYIKVLNSKK